MYQESEIVDLLMAVFLTPVMWISYRSLRLPGKGWFLFGYLAMATAYAFTVAEGYWMPDLFNALEHIGYAVGGIGFAGGCWSILVDSRAAVRP